MSKKLKEPLSIEQLPPLPKKPTINRAFFCVPTEVNYQMMSSVSKDKFSIELNDQFLKLIDRKIVILIPLTNIASIHFDE